MRLVSFPCFDREIGVAEPRPPADTVFLGGNTAFGTVSRGVFWGVSRGITQDRKGLIGALDMSEWPYEGQPGVLQGLSLSLYCKALLSTTWVISVGRSGCCFKTSHLLK